MGSLSDDETFLSFWLENSSNLSNNSNSTDDSGSSISADLSWQCVYIIGTVIPNVIILYAFVFKIKERTYSNICFISLAINDILVGCICLPATVFYANSSGTVNYYVGLLITLTTYAQPPIGLYTLILLTWHRLEQLIWPTSAFEKMNCVRKLALVGIWVAIYGTWIIILIVFVNVDFYDSSTPDISPPNYFVIILDGIYYFFPIFINILLTALTICVLYSKRKKSIKLRFQSKKKVSTSMSMFIANQPSIINAREPTVFTNSSMDKKSKNNLDQKKPKSSRISRDQKAILCLFTILFMNIITQTFFILNWPLYCYGLIEDERIYLFSNWFSYSNSTASPFILFLFHDAIQTATRDLLCCCFKSRE